LAARETQFLLACASAGERGPRPEARRPSGDPSFPVLLDAAEELGRALGRPPAAGRLPARATFVADPAGTVRWRAVSPRGPLRVLHDAGDAMDALRGSSRRGSSGCRLVRACAWCQRLQDEEGWHTAESYISRRLGTGITHGICGDCLKKQSTD